MDSLHAIGFYVSAALAGVGGLGLAVAPHHQRRGLARGLVGLCLARLRIAARATARPPRRTAMSVALVSAVFVAAGLIGLGAFIAAWKRPLTAALTGLPVMFAGAGIAFGGGAGFSAAAAGPPLIGQE